MQRVIKQWVNNFFIKTSLSVGLFQSLSYEARQAYLVRDNARLKDAGERLINLSPDSEPIGRYYLALAMERQSRDSHERARNKFGLLIGSKNFPVRIASMVALAGAEISLNQSGELAEKLLIEASTLALRTNCLINFINAQSLFSVLLSNDGNHKESLQILRGLQPIIENLGSQYEVVKSDFYNSVAYELAQSGKHEVAKGFVSIPLNSPHLPKYPEWLETAKEVYNHRRLKSLSFALGGVGEPIPYMKKPSNVLPFRPRKLRAKAYPLVYRLPNCELNFCNYPMDKLPLLENLIQLVMAGEAKNNAK